MTILRSASAALLAGSLVLSQTPEPRFEVVSIKPNTSGAAAFLMRPPVNGRFTATNVTLQMLIALAYKVRQREISGGPSWIGSDRFDVEARPAQNTVGDDQSRLLLQSMLAGRFQLMLHRETKQVPAYALVPAKNGLKLTPARDEACSPNTPPVCGAFTVKPNSLGGRKITMAQLGNSISGILGPPVIDRTGYAEAFDFDLTFSPDQSDTAAPSLFTALQEQLGLKLESIKAPVELLIIDSAQKPSAN